MRCNDTIANALLYPGAGGGRTGHEGVPRLAHDGREALAGTR